jgi:hypothetical protein
VRRLFKVLRRVVVLIALWTVETPIKVCLLVVNNVENIKIIILE